MRRTLSLSLVGLLALSACVDGPTAPTGLDDAALVAGAKVPGPAIKVMSQNMYLGANIDLLLTAKTPQELQVVFEQLGTSTQSGSFGRAQQMARQIAMEAPHLVGLQEVTKYVMTTPAGSQTLDFIYVLQAYLTYFHTTFNTPLYEVHRSNWTTVDFPASMFNPAFPDVEYTDGDAILVRSDVEFVEHTRKQFDAYQTLVVAGQAFDYRRGFASVLVEIEGQPVRFVNTHLEVQMFEPVQVLQTAELIAAFDETVPVIMVGDFNSAANHDAPEHQKTASYRMLRNAGFADIWLREAHSVGGYTCCQAPDLTNVESELKQRLDLVLVRWGKAGFGGQTAMQVIGEEPGDRIDVGGGLTLWPADHAGVVATLWPAPGRLATKR